MSRVKSQSVGYFPQLIDFSEYITVLQVYFDESERESGIFCVAGYLFAPQQLKKFIKEWTRLFVPYPGGLHMRDLTQRTKSFRGITREQQHYLISEAVKIINRRMTGGFAVSCNADEVRDLAPKSAKQWGLGNAYSLCCFLCMFAVGQFLDKLGSAEQVTYVFEAGHRNEGAAREFLRRMVLRPDIKKDFHHSGDAFLPKEDAVPLQAADLAAWEFAKFQDETLERKLRPIRRSLQALWEHRTDRYEGVHFAGTPLIKCMEKLRTVGMLEE